MVGTGRTYKGLTNNNLTISLHLTLFGFRLANYSPNSKFNVRTISVRLLDGDADKLSDIIMHKGALGY